MAVPLTVKLGAGVLPMSELIADIELGDANFGPDGGTASKEEIIDFAGNWKNVLTKLREILGYHIAGGGGIIRYYPMRHPMFSALYATRISGLKGRGYIPGGVATGWGTTANFQYVVATVQFSTLPYDLPSQKDMGLPGFGEWSRYVVKRNRPRLKYLTDDRASMKFRPVVPPAFTGVNDPNNIIKSGVSRAVAESMKEWVWTLVPRAYVMTANGDTPNIDACIGKVNNDVFPPSGEYAAGTLLLEEPSIEPMPAPLGPNTLFGASGYWDGYVEVRLPFRHFDPPAAAGTGARGHQLYAHPSDQTNWYRIGSVSPSAAQIAGGAVDTNAPRYGTADFTKIFRQVGR